MPLEENQEQIDLNIDLLREARIYIGMPCFGGKILDSTFMSFIKWGFKSIELGVSWAVECVSNESLITRARNVIVASFLKHPAKFTHLLFVDADIAWEAHHLLALLNRDEDVVGGLYAAKQVPTRVIANLLGPQMENGLMEVSKVGTGFLLIKRHVFEKLDAHPSVVPFLWENGIPKEVDGSLRTYFDTAMREGRYMSEDWNFCENWRDLGGKVWLDTKVQLGHTGSYMYGLGAQEETYKTLHNFYKGTSVQILE